MKVDIIIPTYKPSLECRQLIKRLEEQSYPIHKIRIINTQKEYFDESIADGKSIISITHIAKEEFDHGGTRKKAAGESDADILVFMTQDALPDDNDLIKNLVEPFLSNDNIGAVYARQLPKSDCHTIERLTRSFNYPETDQVKSIGDLEKLGIKTYFCSNVCAAYRRAVYEKLGGFEDRAIFNEDMILAYKLVHAGYQIVYKADAKVLHSHNYTCMQQLKRNFDLAVSQAEHPEIFKSVKSESEGIKYVKKMIHLLHKNRSTFSIPYFIIQSGFKFIGYKLGLHYQKLPQFMINQITLNPEYWKHPDK